MKQAAKKLANKRRKRAQLASKYNPGSIGSENSKYGRKRSYLDRNGGMGTDYPRKPWK